MTKQIEEKVTKFLSEIGEHAESVRIFLTYPEGNGETGCYTEGRGNFHAQTGQIREWIIRQDEIVRTHARKIQEEQ